MKRIHFVGIKGVGMTPLAIIAKQAGYEVSGCDVSDQFITDNELNKAGIIPLVGFDTNHLSDIDLVILTGAHGGLENKEVLSAISKKIPVLTQGQALGKFMSGNLLGREFKCISIAGCHGKTTTTAMIATVLSTAGLDPSYVIGTSNISSLGFPGHLGKGDYFIAEADEYASDPKFDKKAKFLYQYPDILVITNIDFDHPDIYRNIEEIRVAYANFLKNLRINAKLIINGDDQNIQKIRFNHTNNIITFGKNSNNEFVLYDISVKNGKTSFLVSRKSEMLGQFCTSVIGEHNALNALASIAVGYELGLDKEIIKNGLLKFSGTKRRFEYMGKFPQGTLVYDDYAHHPTEIEKTLAAVRLQFPKKKIVSIFQPHTFSRTEMLFDKFISSFGSADMVILTDIYASKREGEYGSLSSEKLVKAIMQKGKEVVYLPRLIDVVKYLRQNQFDSSTILISMGAGDIYTIWNDLL